VRDESDPEARGVHGVDRFGESATTLTLSASFRLVVI
jgi:hypothetical protein